MAQDMAWVGKGTIVEPDRQPRHLHLPRIDLLGPPGAGKTTLARALQQGPAHRRAWHTTAEAALARQGAHRLVDTARAIGLERGLLLWTRQGERLLKRHGRGATFHGFEQELAPWSDFLQQCSQAAAASPERAHHFASGLAHFFNLLRQTHWLAGTRAPRPVLFDESLSQRVLRLLPWDEAFTASPPDWLTMAPPPTVLIRLEVSPETLLERIEQRERTRGKQRYVHRALTEEEILRQANRLQRLTRALADATQRRGVPVIEADEQTHSTDLQTELHKALALALD